MLFLLRMRVINMFAGPGYGKSAAASGLHYEMKCRHHRVELVTERAREVVLDGSMKTLRCQPLLFGEQLYRLERLQGEVDWVITDSPILLSAVYQKNRYPDSFRKSVVDIFRGFDNINIALDMPQRDTVGADDPGRVHNVFESACIDFEIKDLLRSLNIPFITFETNREVSTRIYEYLFPSTA